MTTIPRVQQPNQILRDCIRDPYIQSLQASSLCVECGADLPTESMHKLDNEYRLCSTKAQGGDTRFAWKERMQEIESQRATLEALTAGCNTGMPHSRCGGHLCLTQQAEMESRIAYSTPIAYDPQDEMEE